MRDFFSRMQKQHNPADLSSAEELPAQYHWLRKQYVHFCQSIRFGMTRERLHADLDKLLKIPEITHLSFRENNQGLDMLVGTEHLYITNPQTGLVHSIGELIVIINRKNKNVRVINITSPLGEMDNGNFKIQFHHPHVTQLGQVCIEVGQQELSEYIAEGKMYDAIRIILRVLWFLGPNPYPQAQLRFWPLKDGVTNDTA